ncbi:MAG: uncharacterized protein JWR62_958 [Modestobacter sp.]|nr:uncharacterized protein [Modestobacter sp.]
MTTPPAALVRPARRRMLLSVWAAAVLVVAVVIGLVVVWSGDGGEASATPATTTEPSATAEPTPAEVELAPTAPTPEPTGPTSEADALPPSLPAVGLDRPAAVGNGVTAVVPSLEAIDGKAQGPGNVAGPALRATVRISNDTDEPVSLDAVVVDLATGADLAPASPLDDPSESPFRGTVAPGETAEGVYVFTVPVDDRAAVTLSVGYQAGAPFLVFTGSAA